jgi:hypothetical protein
MYAAWFHSLGRTIARALDGDLGAMVELGLGMVLLLAASLVISQWINR